MTKKNLTIYEQAALNYMMVNLATNYAKEYMGLGKSDIPDFDKYIVWNNDSVDVLDGGNDFLEVYNRLGMRSAYIDEDTGLSFIECVVLNEDYEPLYINDYEVVLEDIRVDVDETELGDYLDDLIDEVITDYTEDDFDDEEAM